MGKNTSFKRSKYEKINHFYPEIIVPKALAIRPKIMIAFEKAHKKGVGIAFATYAVVFNYGEKWKGIWVYD